MKTMGKHDQKVLEQKRRLIAGCIRPFGVKVGKGSLDLLDLSVDTDDGICIYVRRGEQDNQYLYKYRGMAPKG